MSDEIRAIHPRALPDYQKAVIPRDELESYALSPEHDPGKHKARVFKSALGFTQADWEVLSQKIIDELPYQAAIRKGQGEYGERFEVILPIEGLNGQTKAIVTGWIIEKDTDFPRLVTTFVMKE